MPRTEIDGDQIRDNSVQRKDLDSITVGQSVIKKLSLINGGLVMTYDGADEGTGDVTLELTQGNFGTQYYFDQLTTEQTTTANVWVEAHVFQTPVIPSGKYIVHYRAQVTNTSKKTVGHQVNWRLDAGAYTTIEESFNPPSLADTYETRAAFDEIIFNTDGQLTIQTNYGQTTAGGTGKIRNISVYLFKVGD